MQVAPFIRGKRYSILPACKYKLSSRTSCADFRIVSLEGFLAYDIVEGSVDGVTFARFIVQDLLPLMTPWPGEKSVIVTDNASIHH